MLLPPFSVLWRNYSPSHLVTRADLYNEIGWEDLVNNPSFQNTCAIRLSLALIKSGATVPGRMSIKKGPHKGALIEMGQDNLTRILKRYVGAPEKLAGMLRDYTKSIGSRNGIISFYNLAPGLYEGGHIDLVSSGSGALKCGSSCHWTSKEVLFWPMK